MNMFHVQIKNYRLFFLKKVAYFSSEKKNYGVLENFNPNLLRSLLSKSKTEPLALLKVFIVSQFLFSSLFSSFSRENEKSSNFEISYEKKK